eukprot:COSAG06_NODE_18685_length_873_cov_1.375969_1_plen_130_part_10
MAPPALLLVLLLVSPGAHAVTPVVLHAWSFPRDVISTAFAVLENGGDALPAVVRGTQQAELNPEVHNVGPGGTPDSAGETTLDAMLMDGDTLNMGVVVATAPAFVVTVQVASASRARVHSPIAVRRSLPN